MPARSFITVTIFSLLIAGCRSVERNNGLMTELATCDSAAVMYYHEPGKPRFFNIVKEFDKVAITVLAENVNGPLIKSKDTCTSQGKIYAYGKGDAVYVVYFNRNDDCSTLSFIKTGEKYFVGMNERTKMWIDGLRKKAKISGSELQD